MGYAIVFLAPLYCSSPSVYLSVSMCACLYVCQRLRNASAVSGFRKCGECDVIIMAASRRARVIGLHTHFSQARHQQHLNTTMCLTRFA